MPLFLDFEASGLYHGSYPIQVGWAGLKAGTTDNTYGHEIMIKRPPQWRSWSTQSEDVHGISTRMLLEEGMPIDEAARLTIEAIDEADAVYSDAPSFDGKWLGMLLHEGGIEQERIHKTVKRVEDASDAWGKACRPLLRFLEPPDSRKRDMSVKLVRDKAMLLISQAFNQEECRPRPRHRALADAEGLLWIYLEVSRRARKVTEIHAPPPGKTDIRL